MHVNWRKAGYYSTRLAVWTVRVLTVLALGFLFAGAFGNIHERPDYRLALPSVLLLLVVAFWEYIWQLLKDRSLAVGKEGISLGNPTPSLVAEGDGNVRDSFIYFGNHFFMNQDFSTAFQFYAAADRIKSSILTSFRCSECIAKGNLGSDYDLLYWYDRALWHADGPWQDLKDRENFAEWVRKLRTERHKSEFVNLLRSKLQNRNRARMTSSGAG